MNKDKTDIHQVVTDKLLAAMERGGADWQMPWVSGGSSRPVNVSSGNRYRGVNVLALWADAQEKGYSSKFWGTFKQWQEKGAKVRKGEKSTMIVFFKSFTVQGDNDDQQTRMVAWATPVFNAAQVDGFVEPNEPVVVSGADQIAAVDHFVTMTGATLHHGGDRAFYRPSADEIHMPPLASFTGSKHTTATEAYYSTLLHELTHWTGPKHRCDRDLSGRFGTSAYAMEELVAELGAAFLCADLGISVEPRKDHAQYLNSWIQKLREDKRAIFTASSKASQAVDFLTEMQEIAAMQNAA